MSGRFLYTYVPHPDDRYDLDRILVLDLGPEDETMRGHHLRASGQAVVIAECPSEPAAKRIIAALAANPGDEKEDPYEEPF